MNSLALRLAVFILLLLWCAGFANSLFLGKGYTDIMNLVLTPFYSPVCHQNSAKLINTSAGNFLVCSRCAGIYIGALVASFIYLLKKDIKPSFFLPAAFLMTADVFLVSAGIYDYSKTIAFSAGFLFGLTLFPYILIIIENSFSHNEIK